MCLCCCVSFISLQNLCFKERNLWMSGRRDVYGISSSVHYCWSFCECGRVSWMKTKINIMELLELLVQNFTGWESEVRTLYSRAYLSADFSAHGLKSSPQQKFTIPLSDLWVPFTDYNSQSLYHKEKQNLHYECSCFRSVFLHYGEHVAVSNLTIHRMAATVFEPAVILR